MKKAITEGSTGSVQDELRSEYRFDYSKSRPNRFAGQAVTVQLDADVAAGFPTSEAVNTALRALLSVSRGHRKGAPQPRRANNEIHLTKPR